MSISRRGLLLAAATLSVASQAKATSFTLSIESRILEVKGRAAKVFGLVGSSGKPGLDMVLGERFALNLHNTLNEDTAIHWHGLTPPSDLDGVPMLSGTVTNAGETKVYDFENRRAGTHWMHSHLGFQEQKLLAAPLIVHETPNPLFDEQEHVILLHDFTFRDPLDILAELQRSNGSDDMMSGMTMGSGITYDAMLANDRTLDDPEILTVEKGGAIRLRIINGCAASNMWIDLGSLRGDLIAVDGNTILPIKASRFPLAIAQRADIRLQLPAGSGAWPVLFRAEGSPLRSGVILQTGTGDIRKLGDHGQSADMLDLTMEAHIKSVAQIPFEPATHTEIVHLTGGSKHYSWGFNDKAMMHDTLFTVRQGERVEVIFQNTTNMAHPMHIHGHYFKVVGIGNTRIDGAVRDTILVPAGERVAVQFDADNPGQWAFHCHHLYHMNSGMMAAMGYSSAA